MNQDPASHASNPFPVEAVATFGVSQKNCGDFEYARELQGELNQYLSNYPLRNQQYGGAMGLRGAHGSGKTHLLNWLADSTRAARSIRATVLYGKCDSTRLFDLYQELMKCLSRDAIIELIQLALLNLAKTKVRSAKITESLLDRLETAGSLHVLQAEQNLDLEEIRQQLMVELQASVSAPEMVRVLLDIPSANFGEDAHRWLTGNQVSDPARLGIGHQIYGLQRDIATDADSGALAAFDTIAALHRIAGVPLIVLVDQLEVLFRTTDRGVIETLNSMLKKLLENLKRHFAMVFLAGTPEAWSKLHRDFSARLRTRNVIDLGNLSLEEVRIFIEAYTAGKTPSPFAGSSLDSIRELSGGSPREILRICYLVFEQTKGHLVDATADVVLAAAHRSGSLHDRAGLALTIADATLPEFGSFSRELAVSEGNLVDRVFMSKKGEVLLALMILKAADSLNEVDLARHVQVAREYMEERWPAAELLVVTIGYSSAEVRDLFAPPIITMPFNEKTFESELRTRLIALTSRPKNDEAQPSPGNRDLAKVSETLSQLSIRLDQLTLERSAEAARIEERFSQKAKSLSEESTGRQMLVTRRDVLDALDSLQEAVLDEAFGRFNPHDQRSIIRSILVANERYLHNSALEELGELYTEILISKRRWEGSDDNPEKCGALITAMRDSLRRPKDIYSMLEQYSRILWLVLLCLAVAFVVSLAFSVVAMKNDPFGEAGFMRFLRPHDFVSAIPLLCLIFGYFLSLVLVIGRVRIRSRNERYRSLIRAIQSSMTGDSFREESIRRRYPQADAS